MSRSPLRPLALGAITGLAVLVPAQALADGTTPTTPTVPITAPTGPTGPAGPTGPKPKPAVKAHGKVYLFDSFYVSRNAVTVPKRLIHANGVVFPYVRGQRVRVRIFLGHRLIKSGTWRLRRSRNGRYGWFRVPFSSPGPGGLRIEISHKGNSSVRGFKIGRSLAALDTNISFGSTGRFVQLIQQRLGALHFYIPQTGVYDSGTGWAVDAYHRLIRAGTSQNLDGRTISFLLNGWGEFKLRFASHGRHAEGNLGLQLLALADGSHVQAILPISSGKPSTPTILGDFQVYSRVPGYLPDGMYYSNFFHNGFAIHGYDPAPDYPASHGCMRLPIQDAIWVFNWLNYGDWVDTY
ncbi:MAG TPA: L,D-transpeptidase [Solirubrobacteraceae bacterium]